MSKLFKNSTLLLRFLTKPTSKNIVIGRSRATPPAFATASAGADNLRAALVEIDTALRSLTSTVSLVRRWANTPIN